MRLYAPDGALLGTRLVATGDGYDTQSSVPVHFGLPGMRRVDVEVTWLYFAGTQAPAHKERRCAAVGRQAIRRQGRVKTEPSGR